MKKVTVFVLASVTGLASVSAQGLYTLEDEVEQSIPVKWTVGANVIWDNNFNPTVVAGPGLEEEAWSFNPYVAVSFTNISPQTTIDLFARLGVNYYLEDSALPGASDTTANARLGVNLTHRFTERLVFTSQNYAAYEMEPEYSRGISAPRSGSDPYTFWSSDNSFGFRWTERVGSFTGLESNQFLGSSDVSSRNSWSIYHQMRYQLTQRTVLTGQYKHTQWSGGASDSTNRFITAGLEHSLDQTSVFSFNTGAQFREVDGGESTTSPFLESALNSKLNTRFSVRGFVRYSIEDFDTIRGAGLAQYEYNDQSVLRLGLNGDYEVMPRLALFGGVDYITTSFDKGLRVSGTGPLTDEGASENIMNLYIGLRAKVTDNLTSECSINQTYSASDFSSNDYDRLRLSIGMNCSF
jgi:hypothetical protein